MAEHLALVAQEHFVALAASTVWAASITVRLIGGK